MKTDNEPARWQTRTDTDEASVKRSNNTAREAIRLGDLEETAIRPLATIGLRHKRTRSRKKTGTEAVMDMIFTGDARIERLGYLMVRLIRCRSSVLPSRKAS